VFAFKGVGGLIGVQSQVRFFYPDIVNQPNHKIYYIELDKAAASSESPNKLSISTPSEFNERNLFYTSHIENLNELLEKITTIEINERYTILKIDDIVAGNIWSSDHLRTSRLGYNVQAQDAHLGSLFGVATGYYIDNNDLDNDGSTDDILSDWIKTDDLTGRVNNEGIFYNTAYYNTKKAFILREVGNAYNIGNLVNGNYINGSNLSTANINDEFNAFIENGEYYRVSSYNGESTRITYSYNGGSQQTVTNGNYIIREVDDQIDYTKLNITKIEYDANKNGVFESTEVVNSDQYNDETEKKSYITFTHTMINKTEYVDEKGLIAYSGDVRFSTSSEYTRFSRMQNFGSFRTLREIISGCYSQEETGVKVNTKY